MAHLTLAGLSDDGKRLLLVSDKGVEFTLDADDRLRAALRGDHARLGQLEIKMDSALRPRDIQARIRSGETPEAVARLAQTTVDAIMPFAAPVLAERQHVAERAQRSSVRRTGQSAGARTLGEAVGAHLRGLNVDPDTVEWDSARREDGKWSLTGEFSTGSRSGIAKFVFDAPGNYVVVDNDDATWLVGDAASPAAARGRAGRRRRHRPRPGPPDGGHRRGAAPARRRRDLVGARRARLRGLGAEQPVEAYLDDEAAPAAEPDEAPADDVVAELDAAEQGESESAESPKTEEPPARPAKKRGRASVPSWDEIMFGGGKSE